MAASKFSPKHPIGFSHAFVDKRNVVVVKEQWFSARPDYDKAYTRAIFSGKTRFLSWVSLDGAGTKQSPR